jgi:hypothetical protein
MRRFAAATLLFLVALLLTASAAYSEPQRPGGTYPGLVKLTVIGHGSVKLGTGFQHRTTLSCTGSCTRVTRLYHTSTSVALTATPSKGWKFAGWAGLCKNKQRTCAATLGGRRGVAQIVSARFIR